MVKNLLFGREKEIGIGLIISIIVSSNALLFFLQNAIEVTAAKGYLKDESFDPFKSELTNLL